MSRLHTVHIRHRGVLKAILFCDGVTLRETVSLIQVSCKRFSVFRSVASNTFCTQSSLSVDEDIVGLFDPEPAIVSQSSFRP
jgi:hypothetical protein